MARMRILQEFARKKRVELIEPFLNYHDRILDVGCGDCWLKNKLKYDIITTDLHSGDILSDARFLPFKDGSLDKVILIEVLEHVNCIEEIKRVLKKDGMMIITIPNPSLDWLINILILFKLVGEKHTPHINKIKVKDIHMVLIEKRDLFLKMSEFGVFKNK